MDFAPAQRGESRDGEFGLRSDYRVLIVERDAESAAALHRGLSLAGFKVLMLGSAEDASAVIDRDSPHLVMVDWDLPSVITMNLVRHIRGSGGRHGPRLIALSTFSGEQQVVTGFELGVDDYVVKPFSVREVVARVRAVLRPTQAVRENPDVVRVGRLCVDQGNERITALNRSVTLRSLEFRLLAFLARNLERAFSRDALLSHVWGSDSAADRRAVDVTVQRIRRALGPHDCAAYLETVRSVGYRLSRNCDSVAARSR